MSIRNNENFPDFNNVFSNIDIITLLPLIDTYMSQNGFEMQVSTPFRAGDMCQTEFDFSKVIGGVSVSLGLTVKSTGGVLTAEFSCPEVNGYPLEYYPEIIDLEVGLVFIGEYEATYPCLDICEGEQALTNLFCILDGLLEEQGPFHSDWELDVIDLEDMGLI